MGNDLSPSTSEVNYSMAGRPKSLLFPFSSLLFAAGVSFVFSASSCHSPVGASKSNVQLSAADVICTQVWLKIGFADSPNGGDYQIKRDGNAVLSGSFAGTDTVVVDTTVQPSKSYTYDAYRMANGVSSEASSKLQVTTLDSTNSNFGWQLYNFGDFNATGMASSLYSVDVINDTDVWAVGEIYVPDSVGKYNAMHWDGAKWNLVNIYYIYQLQNDWSPIRWVFATSPDDIWFGNSVHWDGKSFQNADIGTSIFYGIGSTCMWASQEDQLYVVGNSGAIAYSVDHASSWNKIESGTTLRLNDIYSADGKDIYVAGESSSSGIILKGNTNGFETIEEGRNLGGPSQLFNPYFDGVATTVWVSNTGTVFFAGNALYRYTAGQIGFEKTLPGNYWGGNTSGQYWGFLSQIRGLAENQMVLVGQRNTIRYFNGVSWTQLGLPYDPNSGYTWVSVGMTNDLIVAVGYGTSNGMVAGGIVMMLKRQ